MVYSTHQTVIYDLRKLVFPYLVKKATSEKYYLGIQVEWVHVEGDLISVRISGVSRRLNFRNHV